MRAAIYLRNSDPRQAVAGTHEGQLAAATERAKQLRAEVVGLYSDEGKSAKTGQLRHRGDFARLVADARAGKFDVVIVANIDRLTRTESFAELGAIYGPLQDAGVKVATTSGQILDLNAPDGQLLAMFEAWRAGRENAARRERTLRGRERAAAAGKPPGRAPWGLRYVDGEGWQFTEVAKVVREMYERVANRESTEAIAVDLHRRGVKAPGADYRRAKAVRWRRSTVYDLIVKEVYRGRWRANRDLVIAVPAIVDEKLWSAAQEALLEAKRRGLRRTRHVYLLEGIGRCALCQGRINIRTSTDGDGRVYRYYRCEKRYRAPYGERCELPMHRVEHVDERVWAAVSEFVSRPDLVAEAVARRSGAAGGDAKRAASDMADWQRQLDRLGKLEDDALSLCRRGVLSPAARDRELLKIAQQRRSLERQVEAAREMAASAIAQQQSVGELEEWLAKLRGRLGGATAELRREIVCAVVPGRGECVFTIGAEEVIGRAVLGDDAAGGQIVVRLERRIPWLGTTGYIGVSRKRDKFQALLKVKGKTKYVGVFQTAEAAARAYDQAAALTLGYRARLNFDRNLPSE